MNNAKNCSESILRTGFGTVAMSSSMRGHFEQMLLEFASIDARTKASYTFPHDTDGFLPFGSEYARSEGQPDLCERFCYWHEHAAQRRHHEFASSRFMRSAAAYESEIGTIAQEILDTICEEFGAVRLAPIRASSYLQLCVYGASTPRAERKFAQDPHEDGHLLSFIRPNRDGLVLVRGRSLEPVRLLDGELAVLSGSLLTELSDCAIPAAYHAVLSPRQSVDRSSLIYFVNPSANQPLVGFHRKRPVDLTAAMNQRHTGFGNQALELA
jgi:isopenicillin N synthase-like dioxygenase